MTHPFNFDENNINKDIIKKKIYENFELKKKLIIVN